MNKKTISIFVIVLIILGILIGVGGIWYWQNQKKEFVVCPQDIKVCPDGSLISRTGPHCQFATCPENDIPTAGGECSYDSYKGNCKIISVDTPQNIKFLFELADLKKIPQAWFPLSDGKIIGEISFPFINSTSLLTPEECIKKYGIKKDANFSCTANLEKTGTCTPVLFKFDIIGKECFYQ